MKPRRAWGESIYGTPEPGRTVIQAKDNFTEIGTQFAALTLHRTFILPCASDKTYNKSTTGELLTGTGLVITRLATSHL